MSKTSQKSTGKKKSADKAENRKDQGGAEVKSKKRPAKAKVVSCDDGRSIARRSRKTTPAKKDSADRNYDRQAEDVTRIATKYEAMGRPANPYDGREGNYFALVEALINLGVNEYYPFPKVKEAVREVMSAIPDKDGKSRWDRFIEKKPRPGAAKPLDEDGRLQQNLKVLQRVRVGKEKHPYGEPLRQFGMCIDIKYVLPEGITDPSLAIPQYRLRTQYNGEGKPAYENPYSRRGRRKKVVTADQAAEAPASKGKGRKSKSQAAQVAEEPVVATEAATGDEPISTFKFDDEIA